MTSDKHTRAEIDRLHAVAVAWVAKSRRASDDGHHRDAQQHLRRANELVFQAHTLEQKLTERAAI